MLLDCILSGNIVKLFSKDIKDKLPSFEFVYHYQNQCTKAQVPIEISFVIKLGDIPFVYIIGILGASSHFKHTSHAHSWSWSLASETCPASSAIIQIARFTTVLELCTLQYYLEKNLDARMRELEREAELEEKAPKIKAKSKMSKVCIVLSRY